MGTYDFYNLTNDLGKYPYQNSMNLEKWHHHNVYIDVEDILGIQFSVGDPAPISSRKLSFAESFCLWADLISYIMAIIVILVFCVMFASL